MLKFILFALFVQVSVGMDIKFVEDLWGKYKEVHGKSYLSYEIEKYRMEIFHRNLEKIEKHNEEAAEGIHKFKLGVNQFTDMTIDEFKAHYLGTRVNMTSVKGKNVHSFWRLPESVVLPKKIDWRELGAVTGVKNQGQCGSCWSFSATGSLEGAHFRATNKLVSLSEQQLVDCSGKFENQGCNGGLMDNAFEYVKEIGGIESESSYPYKAIAGTCRFKRRNIVANCSGFVDIEKDSEEALMEAVATVGPISVAIDATQENFMMYKEGVFYDDTCGSHPQELDHGVLVVGYGTSEDGQDYWIVKNSWSSAWGEDGYIRMARNNNNMCGIATQASYPLVKGN